MNKTQNIRLSLLLFIIPSLLVSLPLTEGSFADGYGCPTVWSEQWIENGTYDLYFCIGVEGCPDEGCHVQVTAELVGIRNIYVMPCQYYTGSLPAGWWDSDECFWTELIVVDGQFNVATCRDNVPGPPFCTCPELEQFLQSMYLLGFGNLNWRCCDC